MEECSPKKPPALSTSKSRRIQAHAAIARSLSPFCARIMQLDRKPSPSRSNGGSRSSTALHSLIAASGCMCSSATSDVAEPQVSARGAHQLSARALRTEIGCRNGPGNIVHGNSDLRGKHPPMPESQKQVMPKKGFSGHFNKGYARVSDVYSITEVGEVPVRHLKESKTRHRTSRGDTQKVQLMRTDHGKHDNYDAHKRDNLCAAKFVQSYQPIVKYTCDPGEAFYESMMEIVLACCLNGYDNLDLEDLFACYIILNPPQHRLHIVEAFKLLLTELYSTHGFDGVENSVRYRPRRLL